MAEQTYNVSEKTLNAMAADPNTLRFCFTQLIERLMRHVKFELRYKVLRKICPDASLFPVTLYSQNMGNVICLIISLLHQDLKELYEGIIENIKTKNNLLIFFSRLAENTLGKSPHHLLFFLTIVVRIFDLTDRPVRYSLRFYIEAAAASLDNNKTRINLAGGFKSMNELITEIVKNPDAINEFRTMKCGKESEFYLNIVRDPFQ